MKLIIDFPDEPDSEVRNSRLEAILWDCTVYFESLEDINVSSGDSSTTIADMAAHFGFKIVR